MTEHVRARRYDRKALKIHTTQARAYLKTVAVLDYHRPGYCGRSDHYDTSARDFLASLARTHAISAAHFARQIRADLRG